MPKHINIYAKIISIHKHLCIDAILGLLLFFLFKKISIWGEGSKLLIKNQFDTKKTASVTAWLYIVAMVTLVPVSVQRFPVVQLPSWDIVDRVCDSFWEELDKSRATLSLTLNFSAHVPHQDSYLIGMP